MNPVLSLSNISKSFGETAVLQNISLEINPSEVVAIVGPSGAGKTTLLRLMAGLEKPDSGLVTVDSAGARRAMVFQDFHLWPHKTVLENVMEVPLIVQKKPLWLAKETANRILDSLGLSHRQNHFPLQLSGGEIQRAAIGRALASEPKLVLLDEITSNLDLGNVREIQSVVRRLSGEGLALVLVSHDLDFVSRVADHVVFLENGKIVETGSPREVLLEPKHERTRQFVLR